MKILMLLVLAVSMFGDCIDPMPDCYPCSDSGKQIDPTISPDLGCKGCAE